ncbi:MAG TPA: spore protease YyaC [Clostridia bacterium]|nr:spore protease YyaC [Clostridia bacterium]
MSRMPYQLSRPVETSALMPPPKIKCHHEEPYLITRLGRALQQHLTILDPTGLRKRVIVCIGTDRSTGDSLGPIVGTRLIDLGTPVTVYGTLTKPVHATNLQETLDEIYSCFDSPIVIAVDACLGRSESVGSITLASGALKPGAGVNKELPQVGDIHFTGIVNVGGYMEYFVLQNTRLGLVWKMANVIAASIHHGLLLTHAQQAAETGTTPGLQ